MKAIKIISIVVFSALLTFLLFLGALTLSVVIQGGAEEAKNAEEQRTRIAELEREYSSGTAVKVDESQFLGFDYSDIGAIRYNRLRTLGSHNSYKKEYCTSAKIFSKIAFPIIGLGADDSDYYHENFTDQLNMGLRTFEIDISKYEAKDGGHITATHAKYFDGNSWAFDFGLALKEFALWSEYNPGHMPITILLEIKEDFLIGNNKQLQNEDIGFIESTIADALGDKLLTPRDMLRLSGASSIAEMRQGSYPYIGQMTGKIMCILHPGALSDAYSERGTENAKMFLAGRKYADSVFNVHNMPYQKEYIRELVDAGYIVRTRIDVYPNYDEYNYNGAIESGAQIISSDFVPRVNPKSGEYVCVLPGGKTMLIN